MGLLLKGKAPGGSQPSPRHKGQQPREERGEEGLLGRQRTARATRGSRRTFPTPTSPPRPAGLTC